MGDVRSGKLFDFKKMWHTLFDPNIGTTFVTSFLFMLAFACAIIYGFQPFTLNILHINQSQNAMLFTLFGAIGLIAQTFLVGRFSQKFGIKKAFSTGMLLTAISFIIMFLSRSIVVFIIAMVIMALFNSISQTLFPTILSQQADAKSQGTIMGLNSSYQSIGMILGPLIGGAAATIAISLPFLVGGILLLVCFVLSLKILRPGIKKESAF